MRRWRDKNVPSVVSSKVRHNKMRNEKTRAHKSPSESSNTDYTPAPMEFQLPRRVRKEFSEAIEADKALLIEEAGKDIKDFELIEKAMESTYAARRNFICNSKCAIEELKEEYPCLLDAAQVRA